MAILAIAVPVKEALHCAGHSINILCRNKVVQQMSDLGLGAEPTRHIDQKSLLLIAYLCYKAQIVKLGIGIVRKRIGKSDLEFAR